jgi:protein TonB
MYPSLARTQRVSGDVKVDALIDATGQVEAVTVLTGPLLLQRAAVEAVKQWKYTPGVLDGKPTPMHITVVLQFRIPQTP